MPKCIKIMGSHAKTFYVRGIVLKMWVTKIQSRVPTTSEDADSKRLPFQLLSIAYLIRSEKFEKPAKTGHLKRPGIAMPG